MAGERFNRQFILIDFEDLDDPEFMAFVRSPAFSTYLVLRRHVWRSERKHPARLHEWYARGFLACSLSRDRIGQALGGVDRRTVARDLAALREMKVIRVVRTGRAPVYVLGRWHVFHEEEGSIYVEYFFLDALFGRGDKNVTSEVTSDGEGRSPT